MIRKWHVRARRAVWWAVGGFVLLLAALDLTAGLLSIGANNFYDFFAHRAPRSQFGDSSRMRVLALGDSYVYGAQSTDLAKHFIGFPELLQYLLVDAQGHEATEVINLGYPAADTGGALRRLDRFLATGGPAPNLVLLAAGVNNPTWGSYRCLRDHGGLQPRWDQRLRYELLAHSFCLRLAIVLGLLPRRIIVPVVPFQVRHGQLLFPDGKTPPAIAQCVFADYRQWASRCRATGATPVLVGYHRGFFILPLQQRFANATGTPFIDVAARITACDDADLFPDESLKWHPGFNGYLAIAYYVASEICRRPELNGGRSLHILPFETTRRRFASLISPSRLERVRQPCATEWNETANGADAAMTDP